MMRVSLVLSLITVCLTCDAASWAQCDDSKLVSGDPSPGIFGTRVAAGNDRVAVTKSYTPSAGIVSIFKREGITWSLEAEISPADGFAGDGFGSTVVFLGDDLLISAPGQWNGGVRSGVVYVYRHEAQGWQEVSRFGCSDPEEHDVFGGGMAHHDGVLSVSAMGKMQGPLRAGAVYVFRSDGPLSWHEESKLVPLDPGPDYRFGFSLAVHGDAILIGASGDDDRGERSGSAYVYRRTISTWQLEAKLLASDGLARDEFGWAVALGQDEAFVGAPYRELSSAYVFRFDGVTWQEAAHLEPEGSYAGHFGASLVLDGDLMLVGAPVDHSGAVYYYQRLGNQWLLKRRVAPSDGVDGDGFAESLASRQGVTVVGAPRDWVFGQEGSAYTIFSAQAETSWSIYGEGWPGARGTPQLTLDLPPALGATVQLTAENSGWSTTVGVMFLGLSAAAYETPLGGVLLVNPLLSMPVIVPGNDLHISIDIPCLREYDGITFFAQMLQEDPGATHGVSFTPGLTVTLGV